MSDELPGKPNFDPYHKWLGIPPQDQPPNHYRLLGLALFESDPEVIDSAANRQMAYLQSCSTGPHAILSQRLLNEVASARLCLLNSAKKAAYDKRMRAKQSIGEKTRTPSSPVSAKEPSPDARRRASRERFPVLEGLDQKAEPYEVAPLAAISRSSGRRSEKQNPRRLSIASILVATAILVGIAGMLLKARSGTIGKPKALLGGENLVGEGQADERGDAARTGGHGAAKGAESFAPSLEDHREKGSVLALDRPFVRVFDGTTLSGWRGDPRYWRVSDGAIVGRCDSPEPGGSYLVFEKVLGDFELRLRFKLIAGNSGVQIRSEEHPEFGLTGPQADIIYDPFARMGCLVRERMAGARIAMTSEQTQGALQRAIAKDDWNSLKIVARDSSIKIEVNGVISVDAAPSGIPSAGLLALQLHGGNPTHVMFKEIELREPTGIIVPNHRKAPGLTAGAKPANLQDIERGVTDREDLNPLPSPEDPSLVRPPSPPDVARPKPPTIVQWRTNDWGQSPTDHATVSSEVVRVGMGTQDFGIGEVGAEVDGLSHVKADVKWEGSFRKFDANSIAGFIIDYYTPGGYTKRETCYLGGEFGRRYSSNPSWGKGTLPDAKVMMTRRSHYDLDLSRWAPKDWDGKVWFSVILQNTGRNTQMTVDLKFEQ